MVYAPLVEVISFHISHSETNHLLRETTNQNEADLHAVLDGMPWPTRVAERVSPLRRSAQSAA
jgi:hypothetical protein